MRKLARATADRQGELTAAIYGSLTLRSSPESGERAGYDRHKKTNGSKVHLATDTLGNPLTLEVCPADEQDRDHVEPLSEQVQIATKNSVEKEFSTGDIRENRRPLRRRSTALSWNSSKKASMEGLYYCLGAG